MKIYRIVQYSFKGIAILVILNFSSVNRSWSQGYPPTEIKDKPLNIVYILVDDLGYGDVDLGVDGLDVFHNPYIHTPNLARLAHEGRVFTQHYAADPVCSPSRAGLLTGRTPTRMNILKAIATHGDYGKYFLPGKEITIPELLNQKGYQTAVVGKWHLNGADWEDKAAWTGWTGSFPNQQGFDYAMVSKGNPHETETGTINTQKNPATFFIDSDSVHGRPLGKLEGFSNQIIADSAIAWIRHNRNPRKPYFLYIPFGAPHEQVESPTPFNALYDTGNAYRDRYYGNVTHVDAQIGKILDELYAMREEKNTIVIFSSDNGPEERLDYWKAIRSYGTSAPLFGQKRHLFEGGIREPGIIRWPGKIKPGVCELPNSTLDVLPTLLDAVGMEPAADLDLDGTSILPHLLNKKKQIHRDKPLYWQTEIHRNWMIKGVGYNRRFLGDRPVDIPTPSVAIREGGHVLRGFRLDPEDKFTKPDIFQLYNVVKDRSEMVELSKFEPQRFERMKQDLLDMWESVDADRRQTRSEINNKVDQRD